jgi:outer membrane protein OmpA-like peptidoglycan-associated protein
MYDFPGTTGPANLDFGFESIARGEDTNITYGGLRWGFGLRAGHVVNERYAEVNAASATFGETLERFRDFYVHEPVTLYFDFDKDVLGPAETAKIDTFLPYLGRNPTVAMSIEGFADIHGGASAHNRDVARSRAEAARAAILARGIAAIRITAVTVASGGTGISTTATANAGTGDQAGNAVVGADQNREANRWANRRVVITFSQTASVLRPLASGGTGP